MSNYDDGETVKIIRIYADHCPPKLEVDHFQGQTETAIEHYKVSVTPRRPVEINAELAALQKFLCKKLSADTRAVLRAREHDCWQDMRVRGVMALW